MELELEPTGDVSEVHVARSRAKVPSFPGHHRRSPMARLGSIADRSTPMDPTESLDPTKDLLLSLFECNSEDCSIP